MTEVSPEIQALEQRRELIQVKFQQRKEQLQRELDEEIKHQPIVDTGSECICLIATEAPLKFTGIMGRLAQPFIGL